MRKIRYIALCFVALSAVSCFKEVAFRTEYVVKPLCELTADDRSRPVVPGAVAYAFDADTAAWTVASYDDALAGIITSRTDPSLKQSDPYASSEPYGDSGWIRLQLDREWQLVVVVDPVDRLYAYTRQQLGVNLPVQAVSVVFQPWKALNSYKSGSWLFFNDFYVDPTRVDCFVDARAQATEDAEPRQLVNPRIYAYAVDTTAWRIASYDDAVNGIITSKSSDQTRTSPDFSAYPHGDAGLYSMEVAASPIMLVVVDRSHRSYAYTKAEVDLAGASPTFSVLFRPWTGRWIAVEEGWCIVYDLHAPDDGENLNPTDR